MAWQGWNFRCLPRPCWTLQPGFGYPSPGGREDPRKRGHPATPRHPQDGSVSRGEKRGPVGNFLFPSALGPASSSNARHQASTAAARPQITSLPGLAGLPVKNNLQRLHQDRAKGRLPREGLLLMGAFVLGRLSTWRTVGANLTLLATASKRLAGGKSAVRCVSGSCHQRAGTHSSWCAGPAAGRRWGGLGPLAPSVQASRSGRPGGLAWGLLVALGISIPASAPESFFFFLSSPFSLPFRVPGSILTLCDLGPDTFSL